MWYGERHRVLIMELVTLSPMARQYQLCYNLLYRQASPALRAKMDEAKKPNSQMQEDKELIKVIADIIALAEAPDIHP